MLISSGAFFTHSLAYAWVSQKANTAKATATALYLVHYYLGGSLGGFYLVAWAIWNMAWRTCRWDDTLRLNLSVMWALTPLYIFATQRR